MLVVVSIWLFQIEPRPETHMGKGISLKEIAANFREVESRIPDEDKIAVVSQVFNIHSENWIVRRIGNISLSQLGTMYSMLDWVIAFTITTNTTRITFARRYRKNDPIQLSCRD